MRNATLKTACLLALAFAAASPLAATLQDAEAVMSRDGLHRISVKDIDLAYSRPGATLAAYRRVQLDPVEVEFSKAWNPERTGSRLKISSAQRERIRAAVARAVQDEFARELVRNDGYQVTASAGPDVLRIKPRVVNVYLNAPDAGNAARTLTYTRSSGEMTLMAEFGVSTSGQVLARFADRRASDNFRLQSTNDMVNDNEVRTIASAWARTLRKSLDEAHGVVK